MLTAKLTPVLLSTLLAVCPELDSRLKERTLESSLLHRQLALSGMARFYRDKLEWTEAAPPLPAAGYTLLHLWAVECEPCVKEMPLLKGLLAPYHDRKQLQILLISETLNRATLERFLIRQEQTLPAADYYQSTTRVLRQALGVEQQPLTLLLDADGVVRQAFIGSLIGRREELLAALDRVSVLQKGNHGRGHRKK